MSEVGGQAEDLVLPAKAGSHMLACNTGVCALNKSRGFS
jgi:hypothetical protein